MSSAIGSTDVWDVTPSTPLALSASAALVSAPSLTTAELNMISTSYVVAERRRLPDEAAFATQAPSLALISALVNAAEHAASSSAAGSFAVSLCTFTPAIAASARSLAFAFNFGSVMSARIESRVFSAAAFLSWAEVGDDGDDDGCGCGGGGNVDDPVEHVVALPPGTVSPAGLVVP